MPSPRATAARGAIVIVAYEGRKLLEDTLRSCRDHAPGVPVIVVDNASSDGGPELVRHGFPEMQLVIQPRNLGFAGGCNVGIRLAQAAGADWVLLLNQDARLCANAVAHLERFLTDHPDAAAVQPAIVRADGLVNSLGNPFHYLGFTAAGGNGLSVADAELDPTLPWLRDPCWRSEGVAVPACSGAAVLLRIASLDDVGLLEEELFLYHEDLELSLRLRRAGWTLHLLGSAQVIHHYEFSRNRRKWYFLERNRHWVLLAHYRGRTLALLSVPLVAAEVATCALAVRQGWAREKLSAYAYWLEPGHIGYLRTRRRALARQRRRSDRELLATSATRFMASEVGAPSRRVLNLGSAALWRLLHPLLRW